MKKKIEKPKKKEKKDKPEVIRLKEVWEKEHANGLDDLERDLPHVADEQTGIGTMPNPEIVTSRTTLEKAKLMGVHKKDK